MRISLTSMSNIFNHNSYVQTVVSKIDKRIALVAALLFATISLVVYQQRSRRRLFQPDPDSGVPEKIAELAALKKQEKRIEALKTQYPNQTIFTDKDFETAKVEKKIWMVLKGKVYDLTAFIPDHPGGEEVLLDLEGQDATNNFEDVGHSSDAYTIMEKYCIGIYGGNKLLKTK